MRRLGLHAGLTTLLLLVLAVAPAAATTQPAAADAGATGRITGTIRHQVPGYTNGVATDGRVEVYRRDGGWTFVTAVAASSSGSFTVSGLEPGRYAVVFSNVVGNSYVGFFPELFEEKALYETPTVLRVTDGGTTRADGNLAPLFHDMFDTPFTTDILFMRNAGITRGCNPDDGNVLYCPGDTVTRGQMAAFLARAFDLPAAPSAGFRDTRGHVFETDIDRLAAVGITTGCNPAQGNTRFCPDEIIDRGEMAAFMSRAFGFRAAPSAGFTDTRTNIFAGDIDRLAAADVTRGCNPGEGNTRYCPRDPVTRGQMAAFLNRAFDWLARSTARATAHFDVDEPGGGGLELREVLEQPTRSITR